MVAGLCSLMLKTAFVPSKRKPACRSGVQVTLTHLAINWLPS